MATVPVWPSRLGALGDDQVAARLHRGHGVADLAAHGGDEDVVVVAELDDVARHAEAGDEHPTAMVDDGLHLGGHVAGHGGEQVDTEGPVRAVPHEVHLGHHPVLAHRRRTQAAEPAGLAHRGDQLVVAHPTHAGEHHRMLDLEDVGQAGAHDLNGRRRAR